MKTITYKCKLCGQKFDIQEGLEAVCPVCGATAENLEIISEAPRNKYSGT